MPNGEPAAVRWVTFVKDVGENVQAGYLGAISPDPIRTRTNTDGSIDVSLLTGYYYGHIESRGNSREYKFRVGVPDAAAAQFSDILDIVSGIVEVPAWLDQAFQARDDAEASAARVDLGALDEAVADSQQSASDANAALDLAVEARNQAETLANNAAASAIEASDWAESAEESANAAADSATLAASLSPDSWAAFQQAPFSDMKDGVVVQYNGVQFLRDNSASIAGLGAGAGWRPYGRATPEHFNGAVAAALNASTEVTLDGSYSVGSLSASGRLIDGKGTVTRTGTGNLITASGNGSTIEGITLDMNRAVQPADGQGMSLFGDDITVSDVTVKGFGRRASGGGTGVLVYAPAGEKSNRARLEDLNLVGDTSGTAVETFGWIMANTDYSFASHMYAENILGGTTAYGHELKNTSSYNMVHALVTKYGIYGYGQGYDTPDTIGLYGNMVWGLVNAQCDRGVLAADGRYNLIGGSVTTWDDSPAKLSKMGFYIAESETHGLFPLHLVGGLGDHTAVVLRRGAVENYVSAAAFTPNATTFVRFQEAETKGNFVEILHTGVRFTIEGRVVDTTGNGMKGKDANVVHSPSTGEFFGSRSSRFHYKLGVSGAADPLTNNLLLLENDAAAGFAAATPVGNAMSLSHNVAGRANTGSLQHSSNATAANEYWEVRTGGVNVARIFSSVIRAVTDNVVALGSAAQRFTQVFAANATINTSDAREKQDVAAIDDAVLDAWGDVSLVTYRWIESVRHKGEGARIHSGVVAQQIRDAFAARGLDAMKYGLLCYDAWDATPADLDDDGNEVNPATPAGDRWGIRAEECLFVEAAYQRRRMGRIEARLDEIGA